MSSKHVQHIQNLIDNIFEVKRLLQIHRQSAGAKPGYKYNVEVLNKSAIVLLVACWEAFLEDLAKTAFDFMLARAQSYKTFPFKVLIQASKRLRDAKDEREVWKLAEDGWKIILSQHKEELFKYYLGNFNTPKPEKIDELFESLLGIASISQYWRWKSMSASASLERLSSLIELRGGIAHRVAASRRVHKSDVTYFYGFIYRLAVISSNRVADFISERVKVDPWPRYKFRETS